MKAKIKVVLRDNDYEMNLNIKAKIENEWFYWHKETIINDYVYNEDGIFTNWKSRNQFYSEVVKFLSDVENIKKAGEELVKDVVEKQTKSLQTQSKESEALKLLKELKKPIEIEVKI